jgi:hypothetical protein
MCTQPLIHLVTPVIGETVPPAMQAPRELL